MNQPPSSSSEDRRSGRVLNVQRMSTDDGPGIRTTVFLKGCSLSCGWCHNPESIEAAAELIWHEQRCIGCRSCLDACPHGARSLGAAGAAVSSSRCQRCGRCADECPTLAIERAGVPWSADELLAELVKDRAYYRASGGGVTLSGGEPVLQAAFAGDVLAACRREGLHTALDTSGMCGREALLRLADRSDLVLYDLKEMDDQRHRELTGQSNEVVLNNAAALAEALRQRPNGALLWIRTPLVPGATARPENLTAIGAFIAAELGDVVKRWDLCAFNNLCEDKYRRLGRSFAYAGVPRLTAAELTELRAVARRSGVEPARVHASGPTRAEGDPGHEEGDAERRPP